MGSSEIKVSAPATIANLGPGYDLVGLALDRPIDLLEVSLIRGGEDRLRLSGIGSGVITPSVARNACMVAGRAVLRASGRNGFSLNMELEKGVPPRIGMGSSGASAAAGAFAVNQLLGRPLGAEALLECAMEGEKAACGAAHADNVAPALLGGITIILGYNPMKFVRLDPIKEAEILVATPIIELGKDKTRRARALLPESVPLSTVVSQMSSFASLLLGLIIKDPKVAGQGISGDIIVEPARAGMIPSFFRLKREALSAGAYGFSISGAGPSVFALCPMGKGDGVGKAIKAVFSVEGIDSSYSIHNCSGEGAKVVP